MSYQLGLIYDHRPPATPDLLSYATGPLPAPSPTVTPPAITYPMACNDTEGDCTIAGGPVHGDQVWRALVGETYTYPGDPAVNSCYRGLTGGGDTGCLLTAVLAAWEKGLLGSTIDAYAPVQVRNTTAVKQAIDWFGLAYVGVNLPAVAQQQFRPDGTGVWDLTGTDEDYDIEGGHCIILVGYGALGFTGVTWGSTVKITPRWWATYGSQCYAVIPAEFNAYGGDTRGIDIATLKTDLAAL